ncbi:MAG: TonB-dependent receptor [Acidobacteriota bacterium]
MQRIWKNALWAVLLSLPLAAWCAGATGSVRGTVEDRQGQPVPGASLRLTGPSLPHPLRTASDLKGGFVFASVPEGKGYRLRASAVGYTSVGLRSVVVSGGRETKLSVQLSSGETSVTVTAAAPRADLRQKETGASVYRLTSESLRSLPQGESTPLNQVILQAPGVAQDSFGQLHVRGDHGDVQYRIDGILLPEGINGFGQTLDTRFAQRLDLLTGVLPAQYGYRTAGVVDITPKSGAQEADGTSEAGGVDLYGGARGTFQTSLDAGGAQGRFLYYATATTLTDDLGIESPTPAVDPLHDHTSQLKGFGYFTWLLSPTMRLSLITGSAAGEFQIPNNPGQQPAFSFAGLAPERLALLYPSADLNATQHEVNHYAILALKGEPASDLSYQVALFSRYSSVHYHPDPVGDLIYNGVAADVFRSDTATGVQGDGSLKLGSHTLGAGFFVSGENAVSDNTSSVFPANTSGGQTGELPFFITDDHSKRGWLYGLYAQDRWQATAKLSVLAGVRLDRVSAYVQANQLSPRLIATYQLSPAVSLHAGYAHYFTPPPLELIAPTSIEKFQGTTNALPTQVNTNVVPERSDYFDAGISFRLTRSLQLGLDGYYKNVHDLLDEGQFGQALVFSPFNYRKGRIYGVEATLECREGPLDLYGNVACGAALGKEVVSGQYNFDPAELAYIATHTVHLDHDQTLTGSAGIAYRWGGVQASLDAIYGSGLRRAFANTRSLPPYTQVNLGLAGAIPTRRLGPFSWRLSVVNLLDRVYELRDGSGIGVGAPQYGPRRALYVGLSKRF